MYEITDEEEAVIVQYAAYALAKHNTYQKDGLVNINEDLLYPEESDTEEQESQQEEETQTAQEGGGSQTDSVAEASTTQASLAEALGHGEDLNFTYQGFSVDDNYKEGNYYNQEADPGYQFVVVRFTMSNPTDGAVTVDNLTAGVSFSLAVGEDWVKEKGSLAVKNLSTYSSSLEAGASEEVVLLFQLPADKAAALSDISLKAEVNGTTFSIIL
jgi:hypothetical protein